MALASLEFAMETRLARSPPISVSQVLGGMGTHHHTQFLLYLALIKSISCCWFSSCKAFLLRYLIALWLVPRTEPGISGEL